MNDKVNELIKAVKEANENALKVKCDDGGTCNFDSVIIKLNRWSKEDIKKVSEETGCSISDKLTGFYRGYRFLGTTTHGQALLRTAMAEAAYHSLKAAGFDVCMYYAMD